MKLLIISDTHGKTDNVIKLLKRVKNIDRILHLGDYEKDAEYIKYAQEIPIDYVSGNCDFGSLIPSEKVLTFEGYQFFLTHGHPYGVKRSYERAKKMAILKKCDFLLFGHTHIPYIETIGPLYVMNPGSLSQPRDGKEGTYGLIEIQKDKVPLMKIKALNEGD